MHPTSWSSTDGPGTIPVSGTAVWLIYLYFHRPATLCQLQVPRWENSMMMLPAVSKVCPHEMHEGLKTAPEMAGLALINKEHQAQANHGKCGCRQVALLRSAHSQIKSKGSNEVWQNLSSPCGWVSEFSRRLLKSLICMHGGEWFSPRRYTAPGEKGVGWHVLSFSHTVWLFETPWTAACQACLSITNSQSLLKLMSIESVMPSSHLVLCRPLLLPPSIFPSIRVFSNESVHIRWPKDWSFNFSIGPSNEYSRLISFRMDWVDLLEVQGILKSLLQHHSSKASILRCLTFFLLSTSHIHTWLLEKS